MEPITNKRRIRRILTWIIGLSVLLLGLVYVGISLVHRRAPDTSHKSPIIG